MDNIKEKIEEIVNKIKGDKDFANKFKEEPIKALEDVIGIDLPDEKINDIIEAVKAKITLDDLGNVVDKIKDFFN